MTDTNLPLTVSTLKGFATLVIHVRYQPVVKSVHLATKQSAIVLGVAVLAGKPAHDAMLAG